jgi:hypothetical protein
MPEARSQIAFEELGLGSLLKRYQLRVPSNQREYAWTERETTQLLQDFANAIRETGPYFLGTIVTIPQGEGTLEVVDGQQRLATTAILLAAMRDYLNTHNEQFIADSIDDEFLSSPNRDRRMRVPKLTLNVDDNELFNRIVAPAAGNPEFQPLRASHNLLLSARDEAQNHIRRIVAPLDTKEHGNLLNDWISFIEHRAIVVLLRVPNDNDAYKMFETLNDRGLRTSQADLIKNFLFSRSGEREHEVESRWSYMRGALESTSDDPDLTITFLRHALIVQQGYLREADVFDKVQEIIKSEQTAVIFASTLESLSYAYVATSNPEHERWNSYPHTARRAIEVFNIFKIGPMRSLILAIAAKMSPKETALAFQFLISLGVRLIIASSTRSSSVETPLATTAKGVFEGSINTAAKLSEALKGITPTDAVFEGKFRDAKVSNARLARYYLRSLQMTANKEPEPWFIPQQDTRVINLEHVLPKKPEDNWPQFDEDEVRQLATRIGNLALLKASDNSNLKSDAFIDKKPVYAASPYSLTSQIANVEKWTAEAIADRQKVLAKLAVRTWPAKP